MAQSQKQLSWFARLLRRRALYVSNVGDKYFISISEALHRITLNKNFYFYMIFVMFWMLIIMPQNYTADMTNIWQRILSWFFLITTFFAFWFVLLGLYSAVISRHFGVPIYHFVISFIATIFVTELARELGLEIGFGNVNSTLGKVFPQAFLFEHLVNYIFVSMLDLICAVTLVRSAIGDFEITKDHEWEVMNDERER